MTATVSRGLPNSIRSRSRDKRLTGFAWVPDYLSSVQLWLQPEAAFVNGGAVANGDAVSTLTDRSPNAKAFTASSGQRPTWNGSDALLGGKASLTFNGSSNRLKLSSSYLTGTSGLFWSVVHPTSFSDNPRIISSSDEGTTTSRLDISIKTSGNQIRLRQVDNGGTADDIKGDTYFTTDKTFIVIISSNGLAYSIRINGSDETEVVSGGGDNGKWFGATTLRDNVVLGALQHTGIAQYFVGNIGEWGVCSAENASHIDKLERYLANRYRVVLS